MKNANGFTVIEAMILVAVIGLLAAIVIPTVYAAKRQAQLREASAFHVGDAIYIDPLSITGVVSANCYDIQHVNLLVKSTNGLPMTLENIDTRLLKRVPPSPQDEWKRQ